MRQGLADWVTDERVRFIGALLHPDALQLPIKPPSQAVPSQQPRKAPVDNPDTLEGHIIQYSCLSELLLHHMQMLRSYHSRHSTMMHSRQQNAATAGNIIDDRAISMSLQTAEQLLLKSTIEEFELPFVGGTTYCYWNPLAKHKRTKKIRLIDLPFYAILLLRINHALHMIRIINESLFITQDTNRNRSYKEDLQLNADGTASAKLENMLHYEGLANTSLRIANNERYVFWSAVCRLEQLVCSHFELMCMVEALLERGQLCSLTRGLLQQPKRMQRLVKPMKYDHFYADDAPWIKTTYEEYVEPSNLERSQQIIKNLLPEAVTRTCARMQSHDWEWPTLEANEDDKRLLDHEMRLQDMLTQFNSESNGSIYQRTDYVYRRNRQQIQNMQVVVGYEKPNVAYSISLPMQSISQLCASKHQYTVKQVETAQQIAQLTNISALFESFDAMSDRVSRWVDSHSSNLARAADALIHACPHFVPLPAASEDAKGGKGGVVSPDLLDKPNKYKPNIKDWLPADHPLLQKKSIVMSALFSQRSAEQQSVVMNLGSYRALDPRKCTLFYTCLLRINMCIELIQWCTVQLEMELQLRKTEDDMWRSKNMQQQQQQQSKQEQQQQQPVYEHFNLNGRHTTEGLFDDNWCDRAQHKSKDLVALLRELKYKVHTILMDHIPFMTYMLSQHHLSDEKIVIFGRCSEHFDCVKPAHGISFTADHLPDLTPVLSKLNFTTLFKKKGINVVYFLSKAFPYKCQIRKISEMYSRFYDQNKQAAMFIDQCVEASVFGLYPHSDHLTVVQNLPTVIGLYRKLYQSPPESSLQQLPTGGFKRRHSPFPYERLRAVRKQLFQGIVADKFLIQNIVRECFMHLVSYHKPLQEALLNRIWYGEPFVDWITLKNATVNNCNLFRAFLLRNEAVPRFQSTTSMASQPTVAATATGKRKSSSSSAASDTPSSVALQPVVIPRKKQKAEVDSRTGAYQNIHAAWTEFLRREHNERQYFKRLTELHTLICIRAANIQEYASDDDDEFKLQCRDCWVYLRCHKSSVVPFVDQVASSKHSKTAKSSNNVFSLALMSFGSLQRDDDSATKPDRTIELQRIWPAASSQQTAQDATTAAAASSNTLSLLFQSAPFDPLFVFFNVMSESYATNHSYNTQTMQKFHRCVQNNGWMHLLSLQVQKTSVLLQKKTTASATNSDAIAAQAILTQRSVVTAPAAAVTLSGKRRKKRKQDTMWVSVDSYRLYNMQFAALERKCLSNVYIQRFVARRGTEETNALLEEPEPEVRKRMEDNRLYERLGSLVTGDFVQNFTEALRWLHDECGMSAHGVRHICDSIIKFVKRQSPNQIELSISKISDRDFILWRYYLMRDQKRSHLHYVQCNIAQNVTALRALLRHAQLYTNLHTYDIRKQYQQLQRDHVDCYTTGYTECCERITGFAYGVGYGNYKVADETPLEQVIHPLRSFYASHHKKDAIRSRYSQAKLICCNETKGGKGRSGVRISINAEALAPSTIERNKRLAALQQQQYDGEEEEEDMDEEMAEFLSKSKRSSDDDLGKSSKDEEEDLLMTDASSTASQDDDDDDRHSIVTNESTADTLHTSDDEDLDEDDKRIKPAAKKKSTAVVPPSSRKQLIPSSMGSESKRPIRYIPFSVVGGKNRVVEKKKQRRKSAIVDADNDEEEENQESKKTTTGRKRKRTDEEDEDDEDEDEEEEELSDDDEEEMESEDDEEDEEPLAKRSKRSTQESSGGGGHVGGVRMATGHNEKSLRKRARRHLRSAAHPPCTVAAKNRVTMFDMFGKVVLTSTKNGEVIPYVVCPECGNCSYYSQYLWHNGEYMCSRCAVAHPRRMAAAFDSFDKLFVVIPGSKAVSICQELLQTMLAQSQESARTQQMQAQVSHSQLVAVRSSSVIVGRKGSSGLSSRAAGGASAVAWTISTRVNIYSSRWHAALQHQKYLKEQQQHQIMIEEVFGDDDEEEEAPSTPLPVEQQQQQQESATTGGVRFDLSRNTTQHIHSMDDDDVDEDQQQQHKPEDALGKLGSLLSTVDPAQDAASSKQQQQQQEQQQQQSQDDDEEKNNKSQQQQQASSSSAAAATGPSIGTSTSNTASSAANQAMRQHDRNMEMLLQSSVLRRALQHYFFCSLYVLDDVSDPLRWRIKRMTLTPRAIRDHYYLSHPQRFTWCEEHGSIDLKFQSWIRDHRHRPNDAIHGGSAAQQANATSIEVLLKRYNKNFYK